MNDMYNNQPQAAMNQPALKIQTNDLTEGDTIRIRGKVSWSHIGYLYEGAELDAENERNNKFSKFKTSLGPHTRLSLSNVQIIDANAVNGQPSLFAQYMQQRLWVSPDKPELGYQYAAISKKKSVPDIFVQLDPNQTDVEQIHLTPKVQELASGLDVTVCLRVFKPKDFGNQGISFECVIINEPPRFRNNEGGGNNSASILASFGLTIGKKGETQAPAAAPVPTPAPAPMDPPPVPQVQAPAPTVQTPPPQPSYGGISYDPANDPSHKY